MTRISSKSTFLIKKIVPLFWFGFLTVFVGSLVVEGRVGDVFFVLVPLLMAIGGFVFFKFVVWNLADEVFDGGDYLLIRRGDRKVRIPLTGIMNVSSSTHSNPPRVTLRLVAASEFGTHVSFYPTTPFTLNPFAKNPVAEDLIVRVDLARRKRAA
jgi:hypothetical protein